METRFYTNKLLDMVADGMDKDTVIMCFCKYCSEDDVKDMMECNELIDEAEGGDDQ